jgi:hypothetical protein
MARGVVGDNAKNPHGGVGAKEEVDVVRYGGSCWLPVYVGKGQDVVVPLNS